jgi:hypothetical protein
VKDDTMTENTRPEQRIANAQAARVAVDSQGRPTGKPTRYTYDASGRLLKAEPATDE